MATKTLDQHIEITPDVCGGKPRIAGHRITVQQIVIWHDRMGRSADEIAADYDLDLSDIYAALTYYFDHREAVDHSIETADNWLEEIRQKTPSKVQQKLSKDSADGG